jgi:hypothetical protein
MSVLSVVASSAAGRQANGTSVVDPTARVHHRAVAVGGARVHITIGELLPLAIPAPSGVNGAGAMPVRPEQMARLRLRAEAALQTMHFETFKKNMAASIAKAALWSSPRSMCIGASRPGPDRCL